jgi:hypothetical protein
MKMAKLAILMVEYALYYLNLDTGISLYTVNECALLSLNYYKQYFNENNSWQKKNETFWNIHTFENEDCFQYLL